MAAKRRKKGAKKTAVKRKGRKGHRTAKQKAATRKMLAAARARRAAAGHAVSGEVVSVKRGKGRKRAGKAHRERVSGVRSLTRRVENLESFAHQQKKFNTASRAAIVRLYQHTKLSTPTALLRGPALH